MPSTIVGVVSDLKRFALDQDTTPEVFVPYNGSDSDVMTMEQALSDSIAPRRLNLFLLVSFAAVAFFLALIGI